MSSALPKPDILIVGAGIIGLALALELNSRGAQVAVLERDTALSHVSSAAAGMLAANDPHNPLALRSLARYSEALYPSFLQRLEHLSGVCVPFHTDTTVQYLPDITPIRLAEHSLDPRQLATALLAAVRSTSITLLENTAYSSREAKAPAVAIVHATGAWSSAPVVPRKGQMFRIQLPASQPLREVHRAEDIYIVPRTLGVYAGTALIGATVEDAGFDTTVHAADLAALRARAARILPALADPATTPTLEAWAGLRPGTPDDLPLLGPLTPHSLEFLATGHFRNGILLAPGTARALADIIEGKSPAIDLTPFAPQRFAPTPS